MINSETPQRTGENSLARLAALYPQAFATAAAANSQVGLALQRFERTRGIALRRDLDENILPPRRSGYNP